LKMKELRIRAYNVQFGDAFLITFKEGDDSGQVNRNILIDVGNVNRKEGGPDDIFEPVIKDVLHELGGQPLDLYIMTHEHLDHVQGLHYVEEKIFDSSKTQLKDALMTRYTWLTGSAHPDYYSTHEKAKKKHLALQEHFDAIDAYLNAVMEAGTPIPDLVGFMWLNNNTNVTKYCVNYLRELAGKIFYVHRETQLDGKHPFKELELEIWAPEEDTSDYYGRFQPTNLFLGVKPPKSGETRIVADPIPPGGVDAGSFYRLLRIHQGYVDNLLTIDKAANNTSIVLCLKWNNMRFLFTGDAETRSWKTMNKLGVLKPVNFLKVSHHASHNGTPPKDILEKILPESEKAKPRCAIISTYKNVYNNVPNSDVIRTMEDICSDVIRIDEVAGEGVGYIDVIFREDGTFSTVHSPL
jgi:beta-lactamase superfamily II metal-dependent hydrolase